MNETLLDVKGMSCSSCVHRIDEALLEIEGVGQVDVRLGEGRVRVRHEPSVATAALIQALEEAGYPSTPTR